MLATAVLVAFTVGMWFAFRDAAEAPEEPRPRRVDPRPFRTIQGRDDASPDQSPTTAPVIPADSEAPVGPAAPDYDGFVDAAMARLPADLANREAIAERLKRLLRENPDDPEILAGVLEWMAQQGYARREGKFLTTCEAALALQPGNSLVRWQHMEAILMMAGSPEGYTAEDDARQIAVLRAGAAAEPDNGLWGILGAGVRLRRGEDPEPILAELREALVRPGMHDGLIGTTSGHRRIVRELLADPAVVHPSELLHFDLPFHIVQVQTLGRTITALAEPRLVNGRWEEAVEILTLAQEIGARIRGGGVGIHLSAGIGVDRIATRELERLAQMRGDYVRLQQAQERLAHLGALKQLIGERLVSGADNPSETYRRRVRELVAPYGVVLDTPEDLWNLLYSDRVALQQMLDRMTPAEREEVLSIADYIPEEHRIVREILDGTPAPEPGR